jgi:hypothetical protein
MFVFLLAVVYFWMFIFLNVLHYDYVIISNVIFFIGIAYYVYNSIVFNMMLGSSLQGRWGQLLLNLAFMALLIYPLIFLAVFNLYETWSTPVLSDQMNPVAFYRSVLGVPINMLQSWVLAAGAYFAKLNGLGPYIGSTLDGAVKYANNPLIGSLLAITFSQVLNKIINPGRKQRGNGDGYGNGGQGNMALA